jgi:hypothetical protein
MLHQELRTLANVVTLTALALLTSIDWEGLSLKMGRRRIDPIGFLVVLIVRMSQTRVLPSLPGKVSVIRPNFYCWGPKAVISPRSTRGQVWYWSVPFGPGLELGQIIPGPRLPKLLSHSLDSLPAVKTPLVNLRQVRMGKGDEGTANQEMSRGQYGMIVRIIRHGGECTRVQDSFHFTQECTKLFHS